MSTDPLSSAVRSLALPRSLTQHDRLPLVLTTAAALLGTSIVAPAAYRDYRTFRSYGGGGVPDNLLGWLYVRLVMQPLGREMLSTEVYDRRVAAAEGHGKGDEGFLTDEQLSAVRRTDSRPVVGPHVSPQRQLTQIPVERVQEKFRASFSSFANRNYHLVKTNSSLLEGNADALFLAANLPASAIATRMRREIANLHDLTDHSVHAVLSPADCKRIIEAGLGQRHALSGLSKSVFLSLFATSGCVPNLPPEYLLIYAPRNEAEIEVVMQIIAASVKFMAGREDVR